MSIVRYEPFRTLEQLSNDVNRQFSDIFRVFDMPLSTRLFGDVATSSMNFNPRVDVSEDENTVYFHVELPGMEKEDVSVTVNEHRVLTIKGEKKQESKEEKKNYIRTERSYGTFMRSFHLPDNINVDSINAEFTKGVLNLTLPKISVETPKERTITVE